MEESKALYYPEKMEQLSILYSTEYMNGSENNIHIDCRETKWVGRLFTEQMFKGDKIDLNIN